MLTNKNWAPKAFSTIRWVFAVCVAFILVGCQPPGPKSLLLGEKYLEQGDYTKALKHLTRAAELMDEHPQVWNHLGLAYHGVNQPVKAADAYHRAIRINRNLPAPHYNLGVLLLEQNHLPQAIAELNAFVTLQTNSAAGWTKLGTALVRSKRPDDAERALTVALRLDPKNAEAHNTMGLAHLQRKRPREAMLSFNSALQYQNGYAPALLNQAILAQEHFGNKQLAVERYRAYLSTKPDPKTVVQVEQAIAALEKEISGVQMVQADTARLETNPFTAFLRTNAKAPETLTSHVAVAKSAHATNHSAQPVTVAAKTNPPAATNIALAAVPITNSPATRGASNALVSVRTNRPVLAATNITIAAAIPKPQTKPEPEIKESETPKPETKSQSSREPDSKPDLGAAEEEANSVPVEVVSVDTGPDFKPVADFSEVKPIVTNPSVASAQAEEPKPLIIPRRDRKQEEKPGFFSKVNPVRWFKDENKAAEQQPQTTTPAPTQMRQETAPPPRPSYPPVTKATDPKPEPPRVIARYQYRKNIPLKAGNRSAAQKVFQQGAEAHQKRRLAEAMDAYQNASTIDPSFYDAHYNLGVAAYQSRNLPLALAANELALAAKPSSLDARYNFALTLREANYPADAAHELNALVNARPEEVRAHFALANLYAQQLDQPVLARKHYLAVLELNPDHPEAPTIRQWLANNPQ